MGGHTRSHPVLSRLEDWDIRAELEPSTRFHAAPHFAPFAYPYGGPDHCDARVANLVRQSGYGCAFTTNEGAVRATEGLDRFLLPRVTFRQLQRRE